MTSESDRSGYLDYVRSQSRQLAEIMEQDNEATRAVQNAAEWAMIGYDKLTADHGIPSLIAAQGVVAMVNAAAMWRAFQPPGREGTSQ